MRCAIFILLTAGAVSAAAGRDLAQLEQRLRRFDYNGVIALAGDFLARTDSLSAQQVNEIYRLKAMAHYSLLEMNEALGCFMHILKRDPDYRLDPLKTSPKIIRFFEQIRSQCRPQPPPAPVTVLRTDTVRILTDEVKPFKGAVARSLLLPGWGHCALGNRTLGRWLGAISAATLTATLYSIIDCQNQENRYLRQTELDRIRESYNSYNRAYKRRNALIAGYALIWLYAQTDLLLLRRPPIPGRVGFRLCPHPGVELSFSLSR